MTDTTTDRFKLAIAGFDAANAEDPNKEMADGIEQPKELLYSQRLSAMLQRFAPDASESVQLAIRAQHIRRWESPRTDYPMTPFGYKQWRTDLQKFHAKTAGKIMLDSGYDDDTISRVQSLLRKEALKVNPETQMLEDVVDLVFLESYLEDFAKKYSHYDEEKMMDIIRKTWKKMSDHGHEFALTLALPPALVPLILKAVS